MNGNIAAGEGDNARRGPSDSGGSRPPRTAWNRSGSRRRGGNAEGSDGDGNTRPAESQGEPDGNRAPREKPPVDDNIGNAGSAADAGNRKAEAPRQPDPNPASNDG